MSKIVLSNYESEATLETFMDQAVVNIRFIVSGYEMREIDGTRDILNALMQHEAISIEVFKPSMRDEIRREIEKEKQKPSTKEDHQSDPNWGTW